MLGVYPAGSVVEVMRVITGKPAFSGSPIVENDGFCKLELACSQQVFLAHFHRHLGLI